MRGLRQLAVLEPAVLFAAIMGYIWIWRASHPRLWIAILASLFVSHMMHREGARQLGFGRQSLSECAHRFAPLLAVLALVMLTAGILLNTTRRMAPDQAFLALFAYLPWGVLQQYMLNGYFLNRFDRAFSPRASAWLTAVLFGVVHTPNLFLMAVALVGGWCATQGLPAAPQFVFPGHRPRHHRIPALCHCARFHQPPPQGRPWNAASNAGPIRHTIELASPVERTSFSPRRASACHGKAHSPPGMAKRRREKSLLHEEPEL